MPAAQIGIMQGRLSPPVNGAIQAFPVDTWTSEFSAARKAGLSHIEWIFDREDVANPLASAEGIAQVRKLVAITNVQVTSLCADYFMSFPLLPEPSTARLDRLRFILEQGAHVGVQRVILPFVDQSSITTARDLRGLATLMRSLSPLLRKIGIEVHLETSLRPDQLTSLRGEIHCSQVKIAYDTGNSASLGYDPSHEFAAYGDWIGSVHIKDRLLGGGTVPLGEGAVDFPRLAHLLKKVGYAGSYTLQVARGEIGSEVDAAIRNAAFWQRHLEAA